MPRRRRSGGRSKGGRRGLFAPARYKYLADIISFRDPDQARGAAKEVLRSIRQSKRRDKALREARALQMAANRARASAKRRNLSSRERRELREIAKIYDEAADEAWEIYREKFSRD